ncbi:regulator of protease activity HflC (stomatin/prohibitin superfamily) [Pseudoduganella flava]|uniref:Regulator of protease activity HflC (Stomatin/prohibitin superfamily) n=1 Tax=Pseudoduganella flava TaxID=871742 RepID=A0A562P9B2_9BURK|nr:SPFH domain-containing protein [Pseudoduganella flava]QGZ42701.1 SPFH domain-containing protein [Pseudoduganella flava]TWI41047.1 regulator of protease activity HflC (stomatin/prohibitin superfamily) [Pseudoduganella flava]
MKNIAFVFAILLALTGCTRVAQGEVGLRVNWDKTIDAGELAAGTVEVTVFDSVLKFPIREINAEVKDLRPQTVENVTMDDFDLTVVYNVTPSSVSDLYINKARSFHGVNDEGEPLLMQNYLTTVARNAVYKTVPKYEALKINIDRSQIEAQILAGIKAELDSEKLSTAVQVTQVLVRNAVPPAAITTSANNLVKAQNELKQSAVEVQKAEQEAKRIATLNANAGAVNYMAAQANLMIAEGIRDGKVHAIVVPADFKGMVNVGK